MFKIVISGAKGKMGQAILACAKEDPEIEVVGALDKGDSLEEQVKPGAVVIDFSSHAFTPGLAGHAAKKNCPMVIGTTGLTEDEKKVIALASQNLPIMLSPNMSVGVNLLFAMVKTAAAVLREGFDVEIIEKHHRHKVDSPSGTAVKLAELIAQAKEQPLSKLARHGRSGDVGKRSADEIGIHAVRGGDFVGEHDVLFAGEGETVELIHSASSRFIFARGAIRAAKWIGGKPPGLYDMMDVLGLKGLR